MNGGILLSFFNMRYFRDQLSIYCEFIPQMVFLNGLFGYLCILIVSKWISGSTADLYHVHDLHVPEPGHRRPGLPGRQRELRLQGEHHVHRPGAPPGVHRPPRPGPLHLHGALVML